MSKRRRSSRLPSPDEDLDFIGRAFFAIQDQMWLLQQCRMAATKKGTTVFRLRFHKMHASSQRFMPLSEMKRIRDAAIDVMSRVQQWQDDVKTPVTTMALFLSMQIRMLQFELYVDDTWKSDVGWATALAQTACNLDDVDKLFFGTVVEDFLYDTIKSEKALESVVLFLTTFGTMHCLPHGMKYPFLACHQCRTASSFPLVHRGGQGQDEAERESENDTTRGITEETALGEICEHLSAAKGTSKVTDAIDNHVDKHLMEHLQQGESGQESHVFAPGGAGGDPSSFVKDRDAFSIPVDKTRLLEWIKRRQEQDDADCNIEDDNDDGGDYKADRNLKPLDSVKMRDLQTGIGKQDNRAREIVRNMQKTEEWLAKERQPKKVEPDFVAKVAEMICLSAVRTSRLRMICATALSADARGGDGRTTAWLEQTRTRMQHLISDTAANQAIFEVCKNTFDRMGMNPLVFRSDDKTRDYIKHRCSMYASGYSRRSIRDLDCGIDELDNRSIFEFRAENTVHWLLKAAFVLEIFNACLANNEVDRIPRVVRIDDDAIDWSSSSLDAFVFGDGQQNILVLLGGKLVSTHHMKDPLDCCVSWITTLWDASLGGRGRSFLERLLEDDM